MKLHQLASVVFVQPGCRRNRTSHLCEPSRRRAGRRSSSCRDRKEHGTLRCRFEEIAEPAETCGRSPRAQTGQQGAALSGVHVEMVEPETVSTSAAIDRCNRAKQLSASFASPGCCASAARGAGGRVGAALLEASWRARRALFAAVQFSPDLLPGHAERPAARAGVHGRVGDSPGGLLVDVALKAKLAKSVDVSGRPEPDATRMWRARSSLSCAAIECGEAVGRSAPVRWRPPSGAGAFVPR